MVKQVAVAKARAGLRHTVVCPKWMGRTKERKAQSKRARAGSLAIVDYPQVTRICILQAFLCFDDIIMLFSGVAFLSLFCVVLFLFLYFWFI